MKFRKITNILAFVLMAATVVSCNKKPDPTPDIPTVVDPYEDESKLIDLSVRDVISENGVVAAANPYAAHAGLQVLMAGGNAFDAAVATSFALGLCEPHCSGVAGGGILVGYDAANDEFVSYNFREFVPGKGTINAYAVAEEMDEGIRAAGVPTIVQSLLGILDRHGNFKNDQNGRQSVIGPTVKLATDGFKVTKELATAISGSPDAWNSTKARPQSDFVGTDYDPQAREIFSDDGLALDEGDTMKNPNLAKVLNEIINKGANGFYKGWVADAMLDAQDDYVSVSGNTGLWSQSDFDYVLENYPKEVKPVSGSYNGYDIYSATCPSSGGIILLEALNMLDAYKRQNGADALKDLGHNSVEYINLMSTVTQLAYGDKQKWIGDTSKNPATNEPFVDVPVAGLLNKAYATVRFNENYTVGKAYNGKNSQKTTTTTGGTVKDANYGDPWKFCSHGEYTSEVLSGAGDVDLDRGEHYSTTAFSVADKYGNIVSITQTINHFFGAKLMPKGCGFYLNNQLSSFTKTAGSASIVAPYKHPTSHIMPTIILKDGQPFATLGSPGSMRLVTAVFTTVVNMLDWGMDIQSAIEAARVYSYCVSTSDNGAGENEGSVDKKALYVEQADEINADTVNALDKMGYAVNVYSSKNLFFGGVQGITFEDGKMHGGADIRRDGKAVGY